MLAPLTSLAHWHEFYLLVGTAAAALVALLFVAVSVGVGVLTAERSAGTRTYVSPVIIHFTGVLFTCAVGLVPSHVRASFALLIGGGAAAGAVYSAFILARVLKADNSDWADRLAYGLAPLIAYAAALVAAALFLLGARGGPEVLAGALLLLLVVNIRNAWDLAIFLVRQQAATK